MFLLFNRYRHTSVFFFFNDTATTEIYTLSLHDALPISTPCRRSSRAWRTAIRTSFWTPGCPTTGCTWRGRGTADRKSTRLNSSHANISYAVFCLKKKKYKTYHYVLLLYITKKLSL